MTVTGCKTRAARAGLLVLALLATLLAGVLPAGAQSDGLAAGHRGRDPYLAVSRAADRSSSTALAGARIGADEQVAIFLGPDRASVRKVRFYLNGRLVRTERQRPFDLAGTARRGTANLLPASDLPVGTNTVKAEIVPLRGRIRTVTATFERLAPPPPPPPDRDTVSGRVTDDSGNPVAGLAVELFRGGNFVFGSDPTPEQSFGVVTTDGDGRYEVALDVPASACDFRVRFTPPAGASVKLDPADLSLVSSPTTSRPLPGIRRLECLTAGTDRTGVDAVVAARANLGGRVFTRQGVPVGGGTVELHLTAADGSVGALVASAPASTGGASPVGRYTFWAEAGCYSILFPEFLIGPAPEGVIRNRIDLCVTAGADDFDRNGVGAF